MDYIRVQGTTRMRVWSDREETSEVRWYKAPPGAKLLSGWHDYTAGCWVNPRPHDPPAAPYSGIGVPMPETFKASAPGNWLGTLGEDVCGDPILFQRGPIAGDAEWVTDAEGRSPCCARATLEGSGGVEIGGLDEGLAVNARLAEREVLSSLMLRSADLIGVLAQAEALSAVFTWESALYGYLAQSQRMTAIWLCSCVDTLGLVEHDTLAGHFARGTMQTGALDETSSEQLLSTQAGGMKLYGGLIQTEMIRSPQAGGFNRYAQLVQSEILRASQAGGINYFGTLVQTEIVSSDQHGGFLFYGTLIQTQILSSDQHGGFLLQANLQEHETLSSVMSEEPGIFGDCSDGDVTFTGEVTLTRSWNCRNLTVNSASSVITNGWKLFVCGTFHNLGAVADNGGVGTPGIAGGNGVAGAGLFSHDLGGSVGGGNGGIGGTGNGGAGANAMNQVLQSNGAQGGNGGAGGNAPTGSGGAGGLSSTNSTPYTFSSTFDPHEMQGPPQPQGGLSGGGGGGGGGMSPNLGGGGGGGGSGAGVLQIFARVFNNEGLVQAIGGHGGDGGSGTGAGCAGGGGGGGGAGGTLFLAYEVLVNLGTLSVAGGAGGAGGAAF